MALYRQLRSGRVDANDLQPLFACMGPQQTGKTLVSLEALTELNLIAVEETEGCLLYTSPSPMGYTPSTMAFSHRNSGAGLP